MRLKRSSEKAVALTSVFPLKLGLRYLFLVIRPHPYSPYPSTKVYIPERCNCALLYSELSTIVTGLESVKLIFSKNLKNILLLSPFWLGITQRISNSRPQYCFMMQHFFKESCNFITMNCNVYKRNVRFSSTYIYLLPSNYYNFYAH